MLTLEDLNALSANEAILYAQKQSNWCIWKIVLKRYDIKPPEALKYATQIDFQDVWSIVLNRRDVKKYLIKTLKPLDAYVYLEKISDINLWEIFLARSDIKIADAIEYARKFESDIRKFTELVMVIVARPDISSEDSLILAEKNNVFDIWRIVLKHPDIKIADAIEYANKFKPNVRGLLQVIFARPDMNPDEAVIYAEKENNWPIWEIILTHPNTTPLTVIKYLSRVPYFDRQDKLLKRPDVKKYIISTLTLTQAIVLAEESKNSKIWEILLKRSDLDPAVFTNLAEESFRNHWLYDRFMNSYCIQRYFADELTLVQAFEYIKKYNRSGSLKTILKRLDVQNYLRMNLNPNEAIVQAVKIDDHRVWAIVLQRPDVQGYLTKTLNQDDAILYAQKQSNWRIWKIVLARLDINIHQAFVCAKEVKHAEVLKVVNSREDFKTVHP
jgi:hypothetical protein